MDSSHIESSDQGQKKAFLNGLSQFMSDKGRYLCKSPTLAGRAVDLHDLYNKVTSAGGYQRVTDRGYWEDFLDLYGFAAISVTLAYGLQKIYQTYLEEYERIHFFGDDDVHPLSRGVMNYRRFRYPISEMQRIQNNMNMEKASVSDYDRVVLSLESCLPNEIDFAVNACTLLSGESRHVLRLPQCRRIVDALLLHAGIVSEGHGSYSGVLEELQSKTRHNFKKFWQSSVTKKSILAVLLSPLEEDNVKQSTDCEVMEVDTDNANCEKDSEEKEKENVNFAETLQKRLLSMQHGVIDKQQNNLHTEMKDNNGNPRWSELFHGYRSLGVQDYEGQRVLQIALVLLNLSFEDFNVVLLAHHASLLRFVFLCIHSQYSCLRQTGLDILSNISSHIQIIHVHYDVAALIFDTIHEALLSEDKFERIRGFEILGNICRPKINNDYICVSVCDEIYNATIQNLLINDVELLLSAIEALYRLSKLGEATCTKIIFVRGCIDVLMCLVTLNVRSFGPDKLSEIRLARRISPTQQQSQQQQGYPTPLHPQSMNPQHGNIIPRQMHYQQSKLGSVHQAQPTIAPIASNFSNFHPPRAVDPPKQPPPLAVKPPQPVSPVVRPPLKQNIAPSVPITPVSNPIQVNTSRPPPQRTPPHQNQQKPAMSTPPPSTTSPSLSKTPPGAGPIYTHSEAGTIPPVFHYMPAPPPEIVQDNSPDSFTKLWIWATYESDTESYIPRVDVYCEYLASSNRYGRQGKTEVLSATDFGKCLKQIFPQATSRLFNQGRGQPQYHIAGIKLRATPLPVPGYQLKDPVSVFSSEYEKIVTSSQNTTTVTSNSQAPKPPTGTHGITTPTPSTMTNSQTNMTSAASLSVTSAPVQMPQFQQPQAASTITVTSTFQPAVVSQTLTTPTVSSSTTSSSVNQSSSTSQPVNNSTANSSTQSSVTPNLNPAGNESTTNSADVNLTEIISLQPKSEHNVSNNSKTSEKCSDSLNTEVDQGNTSSNGEMNDLTNESNNEQNSTAVLNGFPEEDAQETSERRTQSDTNAISKTEEKLNIINSKECDSISESVKLKQQQVNIVKEKQLVNGYDDQESEVLNQDFPNKRVNGINGDDVHPTEPEKENFNLVNGQPESCTSYDPTDASSPMCVTPKCQVNTMVTQVTTPTNQLPHSALNQRLKEKITKRKNSQITPTTTLTSVTLNSHATTTPVNSTLPPSVIQQYSYRQQQTKPMVEEVNDNRGVVLAQQIIPITPQQLQQQYALQRQHPANVSNPQIQQSTVSMGHTQQHSIIESQTSLQAGNKRPHPQMPLYSTAQAAKIMRPNPSPIHHLPFPTNVPPGHPTQNSSSLNRLQCQPRPLHPGPFQVQAPMRPMVTPSPHQLPPHPHRPPQAGMLPNQHQVRTSNPHPHHVPSQGSQPKAKQPTIDLMAPNASLLVLYRNVGKIPFANHLDEKEDAISKSVRLTASLILTNIARYSDLGRSLLQQHEGHLASVAMSQMDCSPIIARLLSDMDL